MAGFFNVNQYQVRKPRVSNFTGCGICRLNKSCKTPRLPEYGLGKAGIMFIADAPSKREDHSGKPMKGHTAKFLEKVVRKAGFDLYEDCVKVNAVCCWPGKDREPNSKEIESCRPHLLKLIEKYKPKVIIPMGNQAVESIIGHRWKKELGSINKWRGWNIPDREMGAWICPTFHPEYIEHAIKNLPYVEKTFINDVQTALGLVDRDLPEYPDEEKSVTILTDPDDINKYLTKLNRECPEYAAFDYESNGLKPHAPGYYIASASISTDGETATAFPFSDEIKRNWVRFLRNKRIGKIAANMKFEELLSRAQCGTPVANWIHDTMLATHVLDNRPGITSLKFQAYAQYGVVDYDSHIEEYLRSEDDDNGNSLNRIHEIHLHDLLTYNGVDSILEYRLAMDQMDNPNMTWDGYDLLHDGVLALADAEENGMVVDVEYCRKQDRHLARKIRYLEEKIQDHDEVKVWKKTYGRKFNINSDQQLADILFKKLGYEPAVFTGTRDEDGNDKASVSQEALEQVDSPLVKDLIEIRRLKKAHGTYLGNYLKEQVDGILRPFFHLHTVRTFRSSSSRINFQNQPVRIPEIKKLCRRAIIPRKGRMICEIDYGGIEVKGATCYHKDPNMIAEINDPERDMHRDMAMECYLLGIDEWTKDARYCGKNKFVFPQFYGDYYGNNARDLWSAIDVLKLETRQGVPLKKHLASKGIKTQEQFTEHIKKVEEYFWGEKFRVYGEWKEKHFALYKENGYVDILTGFRCTALMGKNDAINYPIQGAAFHCLLWSFIQIARWLKKNNMKTKVIGQIHDSIVLDIHPDEVNLVLATANRIMTQDIRKHWPWIIVPLEVEVELTPVDGSWYLKKEVVEHACGCGMEWTYKNKVEGGNSIIYTCPVCGQKEEVVIQ